MGILGELHQSHLHTMGAEIVPVHQALNEGLHHIVPLLSPGSGGIHHQNDVQLGGADRIRGARSGVASLTLIPGGIQVVGAPSRALGPHLHVLGAALAASPARLGARLPVGPLGELTVLVARVRVALLSLALGRASLAAKIRSRLDVAHASLQTTPALLGASAPFGPLGHLAVDGARDLVALFHHLQWRALDAQGSLLGDGTHQDLAPAFALRAALLGAPVGGDAVLDQIRSHGSLGEGGQLAANLAQTAQVGHDLTDRVRALGVDHLKLRLQFTLLSLLVDLALGGLGLLAGCLTELGVALLKESVPQRGFLVDGGGGLGAGSPGGHKFRHLGVVPVLHLPPEQGHIVIQ
mmetsp:Transcript_53892/g.118171  ORF Transcript_53892/g.118171 Transcript_53892/m.118171 type:complete len:351 (-) Transcript_53892:1570-2622(-)